MNKDAGFGHEMLDIVNPYRPYSGRREKTNLNFYFETSF